jgi:hypothetical protein
MQMFVAELSTTIEAAQFAGSWQSDQSLDYQPKIKFSFAGRRVSAIVDPDSVVQWAKTKFYTAFSAAIRRIDSGCSIRWL